MIRAEIIGAEAVIANLGAIPDRVLGLVRAAVEAQAIDLTAYVKESKLSGQVLRTPTGTLRRSVSYALMIADKGLTAQVGTNLVYAAIHEYGFDGMESVRAHQRRVTQAFGHPLKFAVWANVGPFSRHMKMPERSFLRSSLRENRDKIIAAIQAAVTRGIKGR